MKPVSELSGIPLRREYCELRGWRLELSQNRLRVIAPDASLYGDYNADFYGDGFDRCQFLPRYESDATLSEGELIRVCKEHGWEATVSTFMDGISNCALFKMEELNSRKANRIVSVDGSTPSEARMRALCAALRSNHEAIPNTRS